MFQSRSHAVQRFARVSLGALAAAAALGAGAHAQTGDWPSIHNDAGGMRYSPLTQIKPGNVGQLKVAWTYHMQTAEAAAAAKAALQAAGGAPPPTAGRASPTGLRASESIPLVIGSILYLGTPYGRVVALDSATGREKWVFELPKGDAPSIRGVSYWPGDGKAPAAIVFGTRNGALMSLNAATGKLNRDFGVGGVVNVKTPEVMQTGLDKYYFIPSPPVIYKNLIITGAGMGEGPGGALAGPGPRGDTRAWDARTGKLAWTFHAVPEPGELGHDSWGDDGWKQRAGVNVWGHMTVDAQRGIVYMPFGAPNNDRQGIDRPGDNLFGSSLVAVDANTGKYLWHFQVVHHDIWDMDTQAPPTLFDVRKDGKVIPAVATVNKNALMFILDRVTGKPIFGVEERPVPQSDVPGEKTSPTQPFPVLPEPLSQNTLSRNNLYKETPEHKAYCEKLVDDNNMLLGETPYTPPSFNRYMVGLPGTQGGVNFYGGAVDPKLGLFVVNVNNLAQPMRIVRNADGSYSNAGPFAGTRRFWNPENHLPCGPLPWGQLVAVDVNTGKIAWRSTLGVTDILPAGHQNTGRPGLGGAITTAAGLTFVGATDDARFRAFETRTGKEIWTVKLPASGYATPITYADAKRKQYVAIVATGGSQVGAPLLSDSLVVYSLP
ncbi:MAG: Quinoprotein glucose dehydrogenase [Caulobacter sp.]|nr:Quinoprotein glucose dehydrogenase [Caulobacter sp.]